MLGLRCWPYIWPNDHHLPALWEPGGDWGQKRLAHLLIRRNFSLHLWEMVWLLCKKDVCCFRVRMYVHWTSRTFRGHASASSSPTERLDCPGSLTYQGNTLGVFIDFDSGFSCKKRLQLVIFSAMSHSRCVSFSLDTAEVGPGRAIADGVRQLGGGVRCRRCWNTLVRILNHFSIVCRND